jgi:hypothetical protein
MADDEKQRDVTRKELADELAASRALNAKLLERLDAMEAKQAAPTISLQEAVLQRELDAANRELGEKRALLEKARSRPATPDVTLVPYSGLVKSTAVCCIDTKRDAGEVFHVDVPALWTDDPYVAVVIAGTQIVDGVEVPITEANPAAPVPINFRFRKVVSAAEDPTPRRASEY